MNEEPLIYTSRGNLPISSLAYTTTAEVVNMNVVLAEEWRLEGEIVKRAVHVVPLQGLNIGADQAQLG